jgi:hypothetical protein
VSGLWPLNAANRIPTAFDEIFSTQRRAIEWHQVDLARGRDQVGNRYADPTKSYPELMERRISRGKKGH